MSIASEDLADTEERDEFGYSGDDEEEPLQAVADDPNEENQEDKENQPADANVDKPKKVPKKSKNPQPKLDVELLKGKKGLANMPAFFENVKYKGKGREEDYLNDLMTTMQHWCHRLFPKLQYDDCLQKLEKLGSKKPLQTLLLKIRLDMVEEDHPIIQNDLSDTENNEKSSTRAEDDFFKLLDGNSDAEEVLSQPVTLTEEQKEIIRRNQELAKERLAERKLQASSNRNADSVLSHEESSQDGNAIETSKTATEQIELESNANSSESVSPNSRSYENMESLSLPVDEEPMDITFGTTTVQIETQNNTVMIQDENSGLTFSAIANSEASDELSEVRKGTVMSPDENSRPTFSAIANSEASDESSEAKNDTVMSQDESRNLTSSAVVIGTGDDSSETQNDVVMSQDDDAVTNQDENSNPTPSALVNSTDDELSAFEI